MMKGCSQQPTTVRRGLQIGSSHAGLIYADISSADRSRPSCYCQPIVVKVSQRSLSSCCIEQRCAAREPRKLLSSRCLQYCQKSTGKTGSTRTRELFTRPDPTRTRWYGSGRVGFTRGSRSIRKPLNGIPYVKSIVAF
jgi:hypothetical protein